MTPFKHILVATDFHASSQRAVETASELASLSGADVVVEHTFEAPSYAYVGAEYAMGEVFRTLEEEAQKSLDGVVRALRAKGVNARGVLCRGPAWKHIIETAKEASADVIVIGTHGRTGVPRALIGSVAEKVVRMSPVPVLTVHGQPEG